MAKLTLTPGGCLDGILREAGPFCRSSSSVRIWWGFGEIKAPNGVKFTWANPKILTSLPTAQGVTQAMDAEWRANAAMLVHTEAPKEKSGGKPASGAVAKAFEEAEADLKQVCGKERSL